ncbi:MAG: V-type ATP synthase subunit E [Oscillospiraceae bacterium]|nr:V-type ATP synthase subunit E [Oscillospiraceae bacterium]
MNGIEKIITHIKSESDAECEAIELAANEECERIRNEYATIEQDEYSRLMEAGTIEAERRLERLNNLAILESKKQILVTQQEMLSEAFAYAAKVILELPESQYIQFLAKQACAASLTGTESVVLSAKDKARIGVAAVDAANAALRALGKTASLTLSDRVADIRGGLILSGGDIEVNCDVDALVSAYKNELSPAVASILFS